MPFQRLFDLAVAIPLALVIAPVCLILLVMIRLETQGPPLFVQERVGRNRQPFSMLKRRTMHTGTANVASHQVGAASITRLGGWLRRLKLDELPQLWNVLAGHMSLVGPRPCLPSQEQLVSERARRGIFALRPGVTGPAQIAGIDMSDPVRLAAYEEAYFIVRRPLGDIRLLVSTALGSGRGDAVTASGSDTEERR